MVSVNREKIEFAHDRVESLIICRHFSSLETQAFLFDNYNSLRYRDAFHVRFKAGECWVFDYGVLVFWGVDEDTKQGFLQKIKQHAVQLQDKQEFEEFHFAVNAEQLAISSDSLRLDNDLPLTRLAASHAFAQSAKLSGFESQVLRVIEDNEYIPRSLATTGHIPLNRKQLAKLRGALFGTRSDIVLNFNLLDTPEFFWEYPELEGVYNLVGRYLELTPRVTLLNKKLETVYELLQMLADEQNHKHSAVLEWIIIVLIAVDILIYFID